MASKFELQNPLFTSVTRTYELIEPNLGEKTFLPNVRQVVNGFFEYTAQEQIPGAGITMYTFSPPPVKDFQEEYPTPEALEAGYRFVVANRFKPNTDDIPVEVLFKKDDGYITTEIFIDSDTILDQDVVKVKPETQVEFAVTFRADESGTTKGYACAYPPLTLPSVS